MPDIRHKPAASLLLVAGVLLLCGCNTLAHKTQAHKYDLLQAARQSGNEEFALLIAQRHVQESPGDPAALRTYARMLLDNKQCQSAITVLSRARDEKRLIDDLDKWLGKAYLMCNRLERALALVQQYLQQQPEDVQALNIKGIIFDKKQQHKKAQAIYRQALDLKPENKILYNLALSLLLSGDAVQSLASLDKLYVSDTVRHPSLVLIEAITLIKTGKAQQARERLLEIVSADQADELLARLR